MKRILSLSVPLAGAVVMVVWLTGAGAETVEHHGQQVDAGSSAEGCIACHDGTIAKDVSTCTVKCDFRTPHAIYKDYPPQDKETLFAPPEKLAEKGIRLVNGQVTCVSCHNLKNPEAPHLVMTNKESALCLTCHVK